MSMVAVIGLGVLVWFLLAVLLALFVGRIIRLRDRQRPERSEPGEPVRPPSSDRADAAAPPRSRGWDTP